MSTFLLYSALNRFMPFRNEEIALLQKVAVVRYYKKKEVILNFGDKEKYISCVAKGLVRKHIMCGNKSISTEFAAENDVICSNSSLGNNMPSSYGVEAVESTTLISFSLDALNWLYGESPIFF